MINLHGYRIKEEIFKSYNSTVFRANRDSDNTAVIIKLLNNEYPSEKELSDFKREFEITKKLKGNGIITVYNIEKFNNSLAIIMEDFGGESISRSLKSIELDLHERLSLAIKITDSLMQIHQQNIIHKDINPANIVWDNNADVVKIIDFGISTELKREISQCINLKTLEGTIPYISPEQTGRMNRPVDSRSDLYSLGITFYELFTGTLPFDSEDEVEIVYSHIAKIPIPPIEKKHEIPQILSDIISKLITKTAEERYQSALGLKKDLEFCQKMINSKGRVENFTLGQNDMNDKFQIPHKLYGREEEIDMLISSFERVAKGSSEIIFTSGYSGIGKSALINEISKPIAGKKGYFISGKYDQLERNIPYYAITQAFRELISQLLTEPQHNLNIWKRNLLDTLGNNAQVIVNIIPELEQIIGSQPPMIELNPVEAQNRFQMTFCAFVKAFAHQEHPLVVFLDDLQWSDLSTLDLLKYLFWSGNAQHIMFIVAYRENEVKSGHPLLQFIEELKSNYQNSLLSINYLTLKPLNNSVVNQLVADTLHRDPEETESLTKIIFQKTKGNPFFTNQVIYSLYCQGAFTFIAETGKWDWNLEKVQKAEISDNVVDFLIKSLELLPAKTIEILKFASCIGNKFNLSTIASICDQSVSSLGKKLWIALEKELVFPLDDNYRYINIEKAPSGIEMRFCFVHDRVRQAAYTLIADNEKPVMHLKIGQEYLKASFQSESMNNIFDIVNQMNSGRELIKDKNERNELSDLNFRAGKMAKKSTAFSTASNYFEISKSLLSEEEWELLPDKRFNLSIEHATAALLSGDYNKANAICEYLSKVAVNILERGAISNIKVLILEFQGKQSEAVDEIRNVLRLFDIKLPENSQEINQGIQEGIGKMQMHISKTPVEELVNLPEMKDPQKLMIMQLLFQVVPPALQTNPPLYILASLMMFDLSLTYGVTVFSSKCFGDCGVIQGSILSDYQTGHRLGESAFAIIKRFKADSLKPAVYFIFTYISHWRVHYDESLKYYDMSYKIGLDTGDVLHAAYAIAHKVHLQINTGKYLNDCKKETENAITFLKQSKIAMPLLLAKIVDLSIQKFQTVSQQNSDIDFEKQDKEMLTVIENSHNLPFLGRFFQYNTFINFIHENMAAAEKWNQMAESVIFAGMSDFPIPDHYLFQGLIIIEKWSILSDEEKNKAKDKLLEIQKRMEYWANNCPANFAHKYYLLSAKIAITQIQSLETITGFFDKSISTIGKNDFIHMRALSNELQGNFWLEKGNETIGKAFIREAHYFYNQWGALQKVALLEKKYSHYFATLDDNHRKTTKSHTTTGSFIDLTSILKSTQAISSEIKIEKLLTTLISIIIENAGAQHGCLLLVKEKDDRLYIEALQNIQTGKIQVMQSIPYTESNELCQEIVQYVARTRENVIINDACSEGKFQKSPYILKNKIKSVLCMPVIYQNSLKGVVYLENNLADNVFTLERLEILKILSSQTSISIDNARLYENMEEKIEERTLQLRDANDKLKELSLHDPLTNLHNRRYTYEYVSDYASKFITNKVRIINNCEKRETSPKTNVLGVYLIDIDHFKEVNDTYGHQAGDMVLISISKVLKDLIRSNDFIIRWGGEEFLIILNDTKPEYLTIFSKKIITTVRDTPIELPEHNRIFKTCSLGFTSIPLIYDNPELLTLEQTINLSDYALYCAKENGRNCAAHFKLNNEYIADKNIKECITNLSKCTKLDQDFFNIEFIN